MSRSVLFISRSETSHPSPTGPAFEPGDRTFSRSSVSRHSRPRVGDPLAPVAAASLSLCAPGTELPSARARAGSQSGLYCQVARGLDSAGPAACPTAKAAPQPMGQPGAGDLSPDGPRAWLKAGNRGGGLCGGNRLGIAAPARSWRRRTGCWCRWPAGLNTRPRSKEE
jgi:hypothetical protein